MLQGDAVCLHLSQDHFERGLAKIIPLMESCQAMVKHWQAMVKHWQEVIRVIGLLLSQFSQGLVGC